MDRVVSPVAGQTPVLPGATSWSPEQTADATEPSGHGGCPTHTQLKSLTGSDIRIGWTKKGGEEMEEMETRHTVR